MRQDIVLVGGPDDGTEWTTTFVTPVVLLPHLTPKGARCAEYRMHRHQGCAGGPVPYVFTHMRTHSGFPPPS